MKKPKVYNKLQPENQTERSEDTIQRQARTIGVQQDQIEKLFAHRIEHPQDTAIIPMRHLSIYFASKTDHAVQGKILSADWNEFKWTARWPWLVGKVPESSTLASIFWEQDFADVAAADVVLVYAKRTDVLRGALVEAGAGIALGKRVLLVGINESYGTWQHHPSVLTALDLQQARQILRTLAQ